MLLEIFYNVLSVYINLYHGFDFILSNIILVLQFMQVLNLLLHMSIELLLYCN